MKKRSFVGGAAILGGAGLLVKLIGALYRIPLTNIIGAEGLGIYQKVYPVYTILLVLSTAGLPTAISRVVSQRQARGDTAGAHKVFRVALALLLGIGLFTAGLLFLFAEPLATWTGDPAATVAFRAISPALLLVSVISAYRGYFQGQEIMSPTATSQIVEQLGKLALGLTLASAWLPRGVEWGAAGTLVGVSLSELAALLLLIGIYIGTRKRRAALCVLPCATQGKGAPRSTRDVCRDLVKVAVPITLGAMVLPLVNLIDAAFIMNSLQANGSSLADARAMYGLLTGPVNTLIAMPAVLSTALEVALVPSIAASMQLKEFQDVRDKSVVGIKLTMLFALPCVAGLCILAQPILHLLYTSLTGVEMQIGANLLRLASVSVVLLSLIQTLTGILQGVGRLYAPVRNLALGAILKLTASLSLIAIPSIGIFGAVIGTVACFALAMVLDFIKVLRIVRPPLRWRQILVKPAIATGFMGGVAWVCYTVLRNWSSRGGVVIAILAAMGAYLLAVLLLGCLEEQDYALLPGGRRLQRLVRKLQRQG